MSVGMPKTHCAPKSKGDGSTARVVTREGASDRPSRSSRNVNSPLAASVALVNTTVSTRSNSASFRTGARSSGMAESVRLGVRRPRRSIQRTEGPTAGRYPTGCNVALSPSAAESSLRTTPRNSPTSRVRISAGSSMDNRSAIVSTPSRSSLNATSKFSSATSSPSRQTLSVANASVSRRTGALDCSPSRRLARRPNNSSAQRRAPTSASNTLRVSKSRLAAAIKSSRVPSSAARAGKRPRPLRAEHADLRAEVLRRDVFEMVGLVEHQAPIGREHRSFLPVVGRDAHGEIGSQQMMVYHHDIGFGSSAPRCKHEALIEVGTFEPRAQIRFGGHRVPYFARRFLYEVGEAAVGGARRPARDRLELRCAPIVEQRLLAGARLLEPRQAQVVPPSLEERERD